MTKDAVEDWSATASENTDVGGINIAESCPAANVNNAMREIMAQVATWVAAPDPALLAQGAFTGDTVGSVVVEVPAGYGSVDLEYYDYSPNTADAILLAQFGTGTAMSPTWLATNYVRSDSTVTNGTASAGFDFPAITSFTVGAPTTTTFYLGFGRLSFSGFNRSGHGFMQGSYTSVDTTPERVFANVIGAHEVAATRTLLRIFPSSGTIDRLTYTVTGRV